MLGGRLIDLLKKTLTKYRHVINIIIILIILGLFYRFAYVQLFTKIYSSPLFLTGKTINVAGEFKTGDQLDQQFTCTSDTLSRIAVEFATYGYSDNKGLLEASLMDEDGNILDIQDKDISKIKDNTFINFNFDQVQKNLKGKKLIFSVRILSLSQDGKLTILMTDDDAYTNGCLTYNGNPLAAQMRMNLGYVNNFDTIATTAYIICFLLAVFIVAVYYLLFIRKIAVEKMYVILGLSLGILYSILIIPGSAPDELSHISSAYALSNIYMQQPVKSDEDYVYMRRCDLYSISSPKISRTSYDNIVSELFTKPTDTQSVLTKSKPVSTVMFQYIPSSIGITLGRLMNASGIMVLLLGRLFNLALFVTLIYYAMRKIPFGKTSLMLVALLPMTIQQSASYSYDAIVIPLAFVVIALGLRMFYVDRLRIRELVMFAASAGLLGLCKLGAYVPLTFIALLAVVKYMKSDRQKAIRYGICIGLVFFIMVVAKLVNIEALTSYASVSSESTTTQVDDTTSESDNSAFKGAYISWAKDYGYSAAVLKYPGEVLKLAGNTIMVESDEYLYTLLGGGLGSLNINVPWFILLISLGGIIISAFKTEVETVGVGVKSKIWLLFISFICFSAALGGMLLAWTPLTSDYIMGVQGRYFIPFLPLVVLCLRNSTIILKKNVDSILIYAAVLIQPAVVYCIVSSCVNNLN